MNRQQNKYGAFRCVYIYKSVLRQSVIKNGAFSNCEGSHTYYLSKVGLIHVRTYNNISDMYVVLCIVSLAEFDVSKLYGGSLRYRMVAPETPWCSETELSLFLLDRTLSEGVDSRGHSRNIQDPTIYSLMDTQ
jgi:hypothetical protein